jgi:transcriptional regulator with XRE-family HTH domain
VDELPRDGDPVDGAPAFGVVLGEERYRAAMSQRQLAEAAGCSRQYVEQLEGGRRRSPSFRTVRSLADALGLAGAARRRFFTAARLDHDTDEAGSGPPMEVLHQLAAETVAGLRHPAYVLVGPFQRLIGWNQMARHAFETDLPRRAGGPASLLELIFEARVRARIEPWEPLARLVMAEFKRDTRHLSHRDDYKAFVSRLRRLADFARLLRTVQPAERGTPTVTFRLAHSRLGPLHLRAVVTLFPETREVRIVGFVPADERTASLVATLPDDG